MFSCPRGGVDGRAAASAIAAEIIPWSFGESTCCEEEH